MNMNIMQLVGAVMSGNFNGIMNMLPPNISQSPMAQNVVGMVQNGDSKGLEQFARNLGKERGVNIDAAYNTTYNVVSKMLGQNNSSK